MARRSRSYVKPMERNLDWLWEYLDEQEATKPGMKGMPGEMPSASYAPFKPPLTGGSKQRRGSKWTDRIDLDEEIRQSNIVPQEDRLVGKEATRALQMYNKTYVDEDRLKSKTKEANLIGTPSVINKHKGGERSIVGGLSQELDQVDKKEADINLGVDKRSEPSNVFTLNKETGQMRGVMTRNQATKFDASSARGPQADPGLSLRWDKKYTGAADAIKNINKTGSVSDMAEAANKMDWSKATNLIASKPLGKFAASNLTDIFGKTAAAKSGFDAAKAFSTWKAGSNALGISNPISLGLKIFGSWLSSKNTPTVKNKRPDKVEWEDPLDIWSRGV